MARTRTKRMRINVVEAAQEYERGDRFRNVQKPIDPGQIIAISSDDRGTVVRLTNVDDDMIISEKMNDLVVNSFGNLIMLTPTGFDDDLENKEDHLKRGKNIAVNPNFIAFKAAKNRGSVLYVDGVKRGILVRETPRKIETLIDD